MSGNICGDSGNGGRIFCDFTVNFVQVHSALANGVTLTNEGRILSEP